MKLSKEFIAMFREEAKKAQWEINCWNGKGIDDLVVDYLERKELKPEDFTGAVVLTVEEARSISNMISILTENEIPELISWDNLLKMRKRIEQVEKDK